MNTTTEISTTPNKFGTIFIINYLDFPFYFDDNIECLSYCWSLIELSKGTKSYNETSMGMDWFAIKDEILKPFNESLIPSQELKDLYKIWLNYFKSLKKIHYNWHLCTENFFLPKNDFQEEKTFRNFALDTVNNKKIIEEERNKQFFMLLRELWKNLKDENENTNTKSQGDGYKQPKYPTLWEIFIKIGIKNLFKKEKIKYQIVTRNKDTFEYSPEMERNDDFGFIKAIKSWKWNLKLKNDTWYKK